MAHMTRLTTVAQVAAALAHIDNLDNVIPDICEERALQDEQWGGPKTDDTRNSAQWVEYIDHQLEYITASVQGQRQLNPGEFRERMVKVAALAIAAIQSYDRGGGTYASTAEAEAEERCGECPACKLEDFMRQHPNGPFGIGDRPEIKVRALELPPELAGLLGLLLALKGKRMG